MRERSVIMSTRGLKSHALELSADQTDNQLKLGNLGWLIDRPFPPSRQFAKFAEKALSHPCLPPIIGSVFICGQKTSQLNFTCISAMLYSL